MNKFQEEKAWRSLDFIISVIFLLYFGSSTDVNYVELCMIVMCQSLCRTVYDCNVPIIMCSVWIKMILYILLVLIKLLDFNYWENIYWQLGPYELWNTRCDRPKIRRHKVKICPKKRPMQRNKKNAWMMGLAHVDNQIWWENQSRIVGLSPCGIQK